MTSWPVLASLPILSYHQPCTLYTKQWHLALSIDLRKYISSKQMDSIPLMPASADLARELFRPFAMDWLRQVPLDKIYPNPIVKSLVDSGKVTRSIPQKLEPGLICVSERGKLLWDTRSYKFSIDKNQQGMRWTVYGKYANGQLAPIVLIRIVDILYNGTKYELTMFQENPVKLIGDQVKGANRKYLEALGGHFSMTMLEVIEGLKEHVKSGLKAERTASKQYSSEEGCLDHQIPIAAQCLEQVRLEELDPVYASGVALKDNSIILDTSDVTPTPGAVYAYQKDIRLNDNSRWLTKKNRTHKGVLYELYHGTAEGSLNQVVKVTSPPVPCNGIYFKVVWYLEDKMKHGFRTYCQFLKDALETLCSQGGALRLIENEIREELSNQAPSRTSLRFILNSSQDQPPGIIWTGLYAADVEGWADEREGRAVLLVLRKS